MTERPPKLTENDIASLAATVKAPESLYRRVQEMTADAQRRTPARRRMGWTMPTRRLAVVGATALAAVGAVLAMTLPGGGGGGALTPNAAAALALGPATLPAPHESASNRSELTASVGGVAFPYWKERFGWHGSGARSDTLGGRAVTTVFYSNPNGQRIGYAIVAGPAPASGGAASGALIRRWGVSYRLSSRDGANVIVWRREGHLCVIAGRGVSPRTLLSLASWGSERAHAA
jgi:hypothetical protein